MKIEFKAKDLRESLKACASAVSTSYKSMLSCICIEVKKDMIEFQATDGNKLVLRRLVPLRQEGEAVEGRYIIFNTEVYKEIGTKGDIEVEVTEESFIMLGVSFSRENDDFKYPSVSQLIVNYDDEEIGYDKDSTNTYSIRLDRKNLLDILKNMKSTGKGVDSVVMKFSLNKTLPTYAKSCYILNGEYDDKIMQGALLMPISKSY